MCERVRHWIKENITGDPKDHDFSSVISGSDNAASQSIEQHLQLPEIPETPPSGDTPIAIFGSIIGDSLLSMLVQVLNTVLRKAVRDDDETHDNDNV